MQDAPATEHSATATYRKHWPEFDVEGVWETVAGTLQDVQDERGEGALVYRDWMILRFVAMQVAFEAARFDPQVLADVSYVLGGDLGIGEENPQTDTRRAAMLRHHHLDGVVDMIISALTDDDEGDITQ